jgi:cobalt-zinc-cadmium efflux system outer membrane protein
MRSHLTVALAGLLAVSTATSALAQPAAPQAEPVTLERAVERFLARNLAVEAARYRVDAARAEQIGARLRPNPSLSLTADKLKMSGPTPAGELYEVGATYTHPIELGGKRRLRSEVADVSVSLAEAQLADVLTQRLGDLKRAFYDALLARHLLDLAVENRSTFEELVTFTGVRVREGAAAEGELVKVRLERGKFDTSVAQARLAVEQAAIKLVDLIGDAELFRAGPVVGELVAPAVSLDLASLRQSALTSRPSVRLAEQNVTLAERRMELERARAVPDVSPFVGVTRVGDNNTMLVGVSVPLPLSDRNQGGIARAVAEQKIARSELALHRHRVQTEVEAAYRAWESAREQVSLFEGGLLGQADESRRIALAAYREGAIDLLGLLDAERTHVDVRQQYVRTLHAYQESLVRLYLASGQDLTR